MGVLSSLRRFDIYRDVPKDLTEQTLTGALITVFCALVVSFLLISEFAAYLHVDTVSEMFVDPDTDHHNHATISIRMNITVPRIPCAVVSVDVQDIMGSHVLDSGGKLHRWRTDDEGRLKLDALGRPQSHESVPPAEQRGEGCNIEGSLIVKQVPGNFHVSAHSHHDLLGVFYPRFPAETLNCTHVVHELVFGDTDELKRLEDAAVAPLAGARKVSPDSASDGGMARSYEYFLKVVPTQYRKLSGELTEGYQYVSNSNVIVGRLAMPAVYFRYEFSPITVLFSERRSSFAHFLVQLCAIVGGTVTVLGLVNGALLAAGKKFKANINKLG